MKYKVGDKVRIRENYIASYGRAINNNRAFGKSSEHRIKQIDRVATVSSCLEGCPYDSREIGYRLKEIYGLVFRESMIECLLKEALEKTYVPITSRWELLDFE